MTNRSEDPNTVPIRYPVFISLYENASILDGGIGKEPVSIGSSVCTFSSPKKSMDNTVDVFSGSPKNGKETEPFSGIRIGFVLKRIPFTSVCTVMVPSSLLSALSVTTLGINVETSAVMEKEEGFSFAVSIFGVLQERKKSMISH